MRDVDRRSAPYRAIVRVVSNDDRARRGVLFVVLGAWMLFKPRS